MLEIVVEGWAIGSIYAVVAMGFVVVYATSKVLNFAHGALGAAGALIMASLVNDGGLGIVPLAGLNPLTEHADALWGWIANLVVAMVLAALLAVVIERIAIRPMIGRPEFTLLILTVGVAIALQRFVDRAPVARNLRVPWGAETFSIGGSTMSTSSIASIVIGIVAAGSVAALLRTRAGLAARAVAADVEAAMAMGIDTDRVYRRAWAVAAMLATLAAVAFSFSPRGTGVISTGSTPELFFRALPVIAIGGWDSHRGAYYAGVGIGILQTATGRLLGDVAAFGAGYPRILPYVIMVVVLLIRPSGVFGTASIRRV